MHVLPLGFLEEKKEMEDRFKFRAWDKILKGMFPVLNFNCYEIVYANDESRKSLYGSFDFDSCVLMQCTGLKDKNGTLIYEGDLLCYTNKHGPIDKDKCSFCIEWEVSNTVGKWTNFYPIDRFDVVGNKYENPELLDIER